MQETPKPKNRNRTIFILLGIGLIAGILGGLLGIGGGAFVVPALVFFLAFDQHRAHGTSLAVVLALSLSSVIVYACHKRVDFAVASEIAVGGVIGAMVGGCVVQKIKSKALRRMFSVFLIGAGAKMIYDGVAGGPASHAEFISVAFSLSNVMLGMGTGLLTGFLSSLLGVGGGIVMVPMLTMLLHFPQQQAQGISLAAMMPIAFTGALKHNKLGNVDFRVAEWIAAGAVVGAITGSTLANILPSADLKLTFGTFLIIMAALMAAKRK